MLARARDPLISLATMLAVATCVLLLFGPAVHAAVGAADPAPASPGIDWGTWVMLGLAALAGVRVIVDALLAFFKVEAPLTKNTVDDRIRDDLQLAHDKLDKLSASVNGLVSASKPIGGVKILPGSGTAAMLVVLLLGLAGAGALTACTAAERATLATDAKAALVNCTAQTIGTTPGLDVATLVAIANTVTAERAKCSPAGALNWQCVEQDAIGDGKVLGGCALVRLVAAAATAAPSSSSGLMEATTAPPPGAIVFADFRAKVAPGSTYHTATGDY